MKKGYGRKGLSSIITSLILILLVLVAIGIVWIFVRNIISEKSEEISISRFTVELEIKNVEVKDDGTVVTVKRGIGKGDLVGIKFAVRYGDETEIFRKNTTLGELEIKTFVLNYTGNISDVYVIPLLKLESGKIVEGESGEIFSNVKYSGGSVGVIPGGGGGNCSSNCAGKECGSDGCGGICGTCNIGETCVNGVCMSGCTPDCAGKECGDDGCGGICDVCDQGYYCSNGECVEGTCTPNCAGKYCGDNGCGGLCGVCSEGYFCIAGNCYCDPQCEGKECGSDSCGGSCGTCTAGKTCVEGNCIECTPNCFGKQCGDDGCGGICGICGLAEECVSYTCVQETSINTGIINSVWPPKAKIYFDSNNLPKYGVDYTGYYAKFPLSVESRCIPITDFVTPYVPEVYNMSYIELGVSYTSINAGDAYEIWVTLDGCNL
jgi:flagellin-like protein